MYLSSLVCLLAGFSYFFLISSSPLTNPLGLECVNGIPYNSTCWNTLKIADYYNNWTRSNENDCIKRGYGANANYNVAACFTAIVIGKSYPCNSTGNIVEDEFALCAIDPTKLLNYSIEEAYVLRGIYGLWKWFQSISEAITKAPPAVENASQIIASQFARPSGSFQLFTLDFWSSLGAGVLDTPLPASNSTIYQALLGEFSGPTGSDTLYTSLEEFQHAFNDFPGRTDLLTKWNPAAGPFNGSIVLDYHYILNQALGYLMRTPSSFLAVLNNGSVINDLDPPTANTTTLLRPFYYLFLKPYLNVAPQNNGGILTTVLRNSDPYTFHKYGHDTTYPISCDSYESGGICSAWYHNNATNATYSLVSTPKHTSSKNYYEAMKNIIGGDSPILTGNDIFTNLDLCQDYIHNVTLITLRLSPEGRTVDCSIYKTSDLVTGFEEWDPSCDQSGCEFKPRLDGIKDPSTPDWSDDHCFPAGYLGDRRSDDKFKPCK